MATRITPGVSTPAAPATAEPGSRLGSVKSRGGSFVRTVPCGCWLRPCGRALSSSLDCRSRRSQWRRADLVRPSSLPSSNDLDGAIEGPIFASRQNAILVWLKRPRSAPARRPSPPKLDAGSVSGSTLVCGNSQRPHRRRLPLLSPLRDQHRGLTSEQPSPAHGALRVDDETLLHSARGCYPAAK